MRSSVEPAIAGSNQAVYSVRPDFVYPDRRAGPVFACFRFGCDLFQIESEIAKVNRRAPGKRLLDQISTSPSSAAASTAAASRATRSAAAIPSSFAEMNDLASGTSSCSTKLIHGGLRYLEHYEFRLVREALMEREVLWRIAPHIIWPLRFVLPHHKGLRPAWLLRLGLFLYDHIGGRKLLPATRTLDLARDPAGKPLKPTASPGPSNIPTAGSTMRAWSCSTRATRPTAAPTIRTRTRAVELGAGATASGRSPSRTPRPARARRSRRARWSTPPAPGSTMCWPPAPAATPSAQRAAGPGQPHRRAQKLYDHDRAYIFQNGDGRIIFAIPYEDDFTLIGTTDRDYEGDPAKVKISDGRDRLSLRRGSEYFAEPIRPRGHRLDLFRRAPALRRRRLRRRRRRRATMCSKLDGAGGAPLLSTSSAARSPPIAGSPRRRWRRSRPYLRQRKARKAGPRTRRCPAAISPSRRSTALVGRS